MAAIIIIHLPWIGQAQSRCQILFSPLWQQIEKSPLMQEGEDYFNRDLAYYDGFSKRQFREVLEKHKPKDFTTAASERWNLVPSFKKKSHPASHLPASLPKEKALEHFDRVSEITNNKQAYREFAFRLRRHILQHLESKGLLTWDVIQPNRYKRTEYLVLREDLEKEILSAMEILLRRDLGYKIDVISNSKYLDPEKAELGDIYLKGQLFWDQLANPRLENSDQFQRHGVMSHVIQWHYVAWQLREKYGYNEAQLMDALKFFGTKAGYNLFGLTFDINEPNALLMFQPENMKEMFGHIIPVI